MYVCVHTLKNTLVPGNLYSNLWRHTFIFSMYFVLKKEIIKLPSYVFYSLSFTLLNTLKVQP